MMLCFLLRSEAYTYRCLSVCIVYLTVLQWPCNKLLTYIKTIYEGIAHEGIAYEGIACEGIWYEVNKTQHSIS